MWGSDELSRTCVRYEGEWRGGKKEGQGTYRYAGGGEYIGSVSIPFAVPMLFLSLAAKI